MQNRLQVRKIIVWTAALVLAVSVGSAEAARWKRGTRPAGTSYEVRGACYYTTAESGTNECRYKVNNGCRWEADSGTNQCTPQTSSLAPATVAASNGSMTIVPIDDGDGLRETMLADLRMTYLPTGDKVTVRIHIRASAASPATVTSLVAPKVISRTPTSKTLLPGDSKYPWNVQRVLSSTGATIGWRPQADQTPIPYGPPPGGYNCGAAYNNFLGSQSQCYGEFAATAVLLPLYEAARGAYYANYMCAVGLASGNLVGTAAYLGCIGIGAGGGFFVYGILNNLFNVGGGSMGGASYHSEACNSIDQARQTMYTNCQMFTPRVP